ncbi:CPBP family glutamic-type intramembrane protease, partial [Acinetobacter baumannii]
MEEFLFRYVPYQLAGSKGLLFSGVSFVFIHLVNPWTGVQLEPELILLYTVITLFLIGSFLFLRSLSMTSLVHALINMGFF